VYPAGYQGLLEDAEVNGARTRFRTIKGATVNRELECLKCVLDLGVMRKYIPENPSAALKHFNELRDRPIRRMLTVEEELRILEAAPPHLRVAMILLSRRAGEPTARDSRCVETKWISRTSSSAWTTT
jgi:hypothetical protein